MRDRALSPVVGTLLLTGVVVVAAVGVAAVGAPGSSLVGSGVGGGVVGGPGASLYGTESVSPARAAGSAAAARTAAFSLSVRGSRVGVTYERGPPISVADLRLRVAVEGDSLASQPPVPFFAARGFRPGPTGPFNVGSDGAWTAGETGSFAVAGTNRPRLEPGRRVTVRLYVKGTSRPVATLTATSGAV